MAGLLFGTVSLSFTCILKAVGPDPEASMLSLCLLLQEDVAYMYLQD